MSESSASNGYKWAFFGTIIVALITSATTIYSAKIASETKQENKELINQVKQTEQETNFNDGIAQQRFDSLWRAFRSLEQKYAQATNTKPRETIVEPSPTLNPSPQPSTDAVMIDWRDDARRYDGRLGKVITCQCPADGNASLHSIYGTTIYTTGSSICIAAVHAGLITVKDGGIAKIEILPGQDQYNGMPRHGINSRSGGRNNWSFRFVE